MNTRSMVFTLFGDYIRHYDNNIWMGSLIRLLQEFGHNEQAVRAAVSRMYRQGWLQSSRKGNRSFYSLTARGMDRMEEAGARIFKLRTVTWDGKWRVFMYSIPEKRRSIRDELRKELVWSGFGALSSSCWISPNDLNRQVEGLIDKYSIAGDVHFFTAVYDGPGDNSRLVQECWNLKSAALRYREFIEEYSRKYEQSAALIQKGKLSDSQCFVEKTILVHEYRKFLFIDPGLPAELLPDPWEGNEAASLFSEYYRKLAEPATRFYESVYRLGHTLMKSGRSHDIYQHPLMAEE